MSESYKHLFATIYDRLIDRSMDEAWQRFVKEAWQRANIMPETIVDLGCGTGRHAIAFAREKLQVFGIDLSDSMLTVARDQSELQAPDIQASGGSVTWLSQDMREWVVGRQVDSVLCLSDGINYLLDEEDVQRTFAATYEHLREGGLFIFDVLTAHQYRRYEEDQPYTYDDDDLAYIWYSEWSAEQRIMTHDLTIFVEEEEGSDRFVRVMETHRQRAYGQEQLVEWLKAAGFRTVDCYADFRWVEPREDAGRLFFCAIK